MSKDFARNSQNVYRIGNHPAYKALRVELGLEPIDVDARPTDRHTESADDGQRSNWGTRAKASGRVHR